MKWKLLERITKRCTKNVVQIHDNKENVTKHLNQTVKSCYYFLIKKIKKRGMNTALVLT